MRNIVFLVVIVVFWFLVNSTLVLMANDPSINSIAQLGNTSLDISVDNSTFNATATTEDPIKRTNIIGMFFRSLTFRLPEQIVPPAFEFVLGFINYLLVGLLVLVLYRIALPTGGGG